MKKMKFNRKGFFAPEVIVMAIMLAIIIIGIDMIQTNRMNKMQDDPTSDLYYSQSEVICRNKSKELNYPFYKVHYTRNLMQNTKCTLSNEKDYEEDSAVFIEMIQRDRKWIFEYEENTISEQEKPQESRNEYICKNMAKELGFEFSKVKYSKNALNENQCMISKDEEMKAEKSVYKIIKPYGT